MNDYKIKELYEEMEMDLIDSMNRNLSRHLTEEDEVGFKYTQWQTEKLKELKRFQRENKSIIGGYVKGLNKKVSEHLQEELRQGSISAIKQYNKLLGDNKNPNKLMNRSFFKTNDRKVKALIKSVNNDLNKANTGALRMINDEYRQIIHKSAFFVANGVKTEQQATGMAIKEINQKKLTMEACDDVSDTFLAGGLNCIEYSNGRRVNIASYAAMAVRTASLRAHLMGEGDFRKSIGRSLVKVTSHGGACKICTKWQGKVLVDDVYSGGEPDGKHQLLSEAMKEGFLHPNCRHGITTYYPELEGISYDEDEGDEFLPDDLKDQYNYYNRLSKSWNRKRHGFIDPDNKKDARKNYLACEKKKEEVLVVKGESRNLKNYHKAIEKGYWNGNMKYCHEVTDEWLGEPPIRKNVVIKPKLHSCFKYKGKEYYIDGNDIVIQFDNGEEKFADLIATKTRKKIELFPRFNKPENMRSADSKIGREYVDFKITKSGSDKFITENIYKAEGQANHFAFDIKNKNVTKDEILYQVDNSFRRFKYAKTIIVNSKHGFYVFKR